MFSPGRWRLIQLWDVAKREQGAIFSGHAGSVNSVAFTPDGTILASGYGRGSGAVKLWDVAYGAAFRDPRFPALSLPEREGLAISISVLSEREEMESEEDLLGQLQPGVDGLLMEADHHRGTLLPSVWAVLPDSATFLRQLKRKAGLADDFWSDTLRISRYTTESF